MKKFVSFIENNTSIIITLGIPLGLIFPQFAVFKPYLTTFLMLVLFFTFLKLDIVEAFKHLKRIKLILYVLAIDLVLLPILVFSVFKLAKAPIFIISSMLLFSSVPAGVASAAMTDLLNGDTTLSTVIIVITHFIAPITIPLLFYVLLRKVIHVNYLDISITLTKLIFIPLILANIFKVVFPKLTKNITNYNKIITTAILLMLGTTITAINYNFIVNNPIDSINFILMTIPVYFSFIIIPYFLTPFLPLKERVSIFATKTFMNVTIGVVLAISFLDAKASLVLTLAQIPWSLMIFPAQIFVKFVNKKSPR